MVKKLILRSGAFVLAMIIFFGFVMGAMFLVGRSNWVNPINVRAIGQSSARAMCTMDVDTGRVLFSNNMNEKMGMASTTKILTALTVLENLADIDTKIKINDQAIGIEGSSIYLQKGEELTVRELLYGLMLRSGNDTAVALALIVSPSVEEFAKLMNQTAMKYGAQHSNFVNPHGLDDKEHYTTAKDLAMISSAALKNPIFAEIVAAKEKRIDGPEAPRLLINKNKMLKTLDTAIGVKTGFTKKTGRCFVGASEEDGQKIVTVVLNCGPMFEDASQLLRDAHRIYSNKEILKTEQVFTDKSGVKAIATQDFSYPLADSEMLGLDITVQDNNVRIVVNNKIIHESECVQIAE